MINRKIFCKSVPWIGTTTAAKASRKKATGSGGECLRDGVGPHQPGGSAWGSAVSSPSRVRVGAPAAQRFLARKFLHFGVFTVF